MSEYYAYATPDKKLMKLFLDCPDYVRRVVITDHQADIVKAIKNNFNNAAKSSDIRDYLGCSIQSASTQLTKLWYSGYLERREIVAESGGIEHVYRSAI